MATEWQSRQDGEGGVVLGSCEGEEGRNDEGGKHACLRGGTEWFMVGSMFKAAGGPGGGGGEAGSTGTNGWDLLPWERTQAAQLGLVPRLRDQLASLGPVPIPPLPPSGISPGVVVAL